MIVGAKSDIGKVRKINQDNYFASEDDDFPLYIIADGMGGHKAGEKASKMGIEIISEFLKENLTDDMEKEEIMKLLKTSVEKANTEIYLESINNKECEGMGTTITLAYIDGEYVYIAHVGDSRAYLFRDSGFKQITEDHSFVEALVKSGDISKEEAKHHPKRNLITRAVGSSSIIEVDLFREKIKLGDTLILLSDGITNMISDEKLYMEIKNSSDIQKSCEKIIKEANDLGGIDNSTIIGIRLGSEVKK